MDCKLVINKKKTKIDYLIKPYFVQRDPYYSEKERENVCVENVEGKARVVNKWAFNIQVGLALETCKLAQQVNTSIINLLNYRFIIFSTDQNLLFKGTHSN